MKKKKDSIILIICALIMLVSVSYSWMLGKEAQTVKSVQMDFAEDNRLTIYSPSSVRLSVLYLNESTGQYEEWDPEDMVSLKAFDNMVPGGSVEFKLRIRNTSNTLQTMKLTVGGIKNTENNVKFEKSLIPMTFMSVTPGKGFRDTINPDVLIPEQQFHRLDEADFIDGVGSMVIYDTLTIPPTEGQSVPYVELDCYFWLDHQAGSEYQDMSMEVGYFRLSD